MNDISFVSPTYKSQLSNSYIMSVQLRLDGLSFCIYDAVVNSFLVFGNVDFEDPDELFSHHEEYIMRNDIFSLKYKKVIVGVESKLATMMPEALYEEGRDAEVLRYVGANLTKDDYILTDIIEIAQSRTLYYIPQFLYYFLQTQFSNLIIRYIGTPIVEMMLSRRSLDDKRQMVNVFYGRNRVLVIATEDNRLKLCNEYSSFDDNDLVYYVVYALEQLGMNTDDVSVTVSGEVDKRDDKYIMLCRYVHNVRIATLPNKFQYGFNLAKLGEHKFVNLFLMALCE